MHNNHPSIKRTLLYYITLPVFILFLITGGVALFAAHEEIQEVYDAQLVHAAKVLLQLTEHEVGEHETYQIKLGLERPELFHGYEKNITFRIWKDNHLVTQSSGADQLGYLSAPMGFSNQLINSQSWRFFIFMDTKTGITIEVAEREKIRSELIFEIILSFLVPLLLFIPFLVLAIWIGVSKSLKPMIQLSQSVKKRDTDDLSKIELKQAPHEIYPLLKALNGLLERIKSSFERERQFTDNAAHELRTPLAAMKTQTQVLMKKAKEMPACQEGLENLHASINRATHLVDQLLSFARLQSEDIKKSDIDLSKIIHSVLRDIAPEFIKKNQDIDVTVSKNLKVHGNKQALSILVHNLIDNAIKYTPRNGSIKIYAEQKIDKVIFTITDTGVGISDIEKAKVFNRFYRTNKSEEFGSGLGLSIVQWIAEIHNADITLEDNNPSGLVVKILMEVA